MVQVQTIPNVGRKLRNPQHNFFCAFRPWQIQPCVLAPVLPGETLKNALFQMRAVSDPIKSAIGGWWFEFYLFYVKHRDMPDASTWVDMVLEHGHDVSAKYSAAVGNHYHYGNTINWTEQCLQAVVQHYFRDDDETWNGFTVGTLPSAKLSIENFTESAILASSIPAGDTIPAGEDAGDVQRMLETWEFLRANKLTNMTYEDFLRSYGVRSKLAERNKPELIRYVRDWTYPSNTIDPADGSPVSAVSWSIAERADKDRFFSEPGFLFGCVVCRPKVYFDNLQGSAAGLMTNTLTWLPAIMEDQPMTSLVKIAGGTGPMGATVAVDHWVDIRDLFLYGDQFVNGSGTDYTWCNKVELPDASLNRKYASATDADALFSGTSKKIKVDGVCRLSILGRQADHT